MTDDVCLMTILYARLLVWFVWVFQMALGHSLANNRGRIISPSALSDNALVITFLAASVTMWAAASYRKKIEKYRWLASPKASTYKTSANVSRVRENSRSSLQSSCNCQ
jgi:hypothetical protein